MNKRSLFTAVVLMTAPVATLFADHPSATDSTAPAYHDRVHVFESTGLELRNPKVRQGKAGQNSAAFVVITNESDEDHHIVKAITPVAKVVELHTSFEEDGVHRMRPVPEIVVPADGQVELKSGGYHVMLIGLNHDLVKGQEIPITLQLKDGRVIQATYPVTGCCGSCHGKTKSPTSN